MAALATLSLGISSLNPQKASAEGCVRAPHTVTVNQSSQNATPGQVVYFTYTITNNDSGDCGASDFTFDTANKPADWTVAPYNGTERVDVGEYTDYAVWYTVPTDVYNGPYQFPVEIYRSEEPTTLTVPVQINVTGGREWQQPPTPPTPPAPTPDTTGPSLTIASPVAGSTVKKGSTVSINVNATDPSGIKRIDYYVDGFVVCINYGTSCQWKVPNRKATFQIEVRAEDNAGNVTSKFTSVKAL